MIREADRRNRLSSRTLQPTSARGLRFECFFISSEIFSQDSNNINLINHISGRISTTNNGISLIPTFSLGKPAVLFTLSLAKNKLSFEPDFNFSLEGKPWSMLFWWRYKMVQRDNFSMRIGINPNFSYRTITTYNNGISKDLIETRRFLAGEVMPIYSLSKNFKVGIYYIYAFGFDDSSTLPHSSPSITQSKFISFK